MTRDEMRQVRVVDLDAEQAYDVIRSGVLWGAVQAAVVWVVVMLAVTGAPFVLWILLGGMIASGG